MAASDLRTNARKKRQEAERARTLARELADGPRKNLIGYAVDLDKEAAELEQRGEKEDRPD